MIAPSSTLGTTLEAMRQRVRRLEQEAAALRSDLDEMAVLVEWETQQAVSPETLQQTDVTDAELTNYQKMLGAQWDEAILRLTLQAQKIATRLKQSVLPAERDAAMKAVTQAFQQAAEASGMDIPAELEAVIGD